MRPILALLALCFLAGCSKTSTRSVADPFELAIIPESLKAACRDVVTLPDRDITISEASRLWARDRESLGDCSRRHKGLADAVRSVERQGK